MLCRLLARTNHGLRPMTTKEIATQSGLSLERVVQISNLRTWSSVPLGAIESFSRACGVNLLAPSEQIKFLRRRKRAYFFRATPSQRRMLGRLMEILSRNLDVAD